MPTLNFIQLSPGLSKSLIDLVNHVLSIHDTSRFSKANRDLMECGGSIDLSLLGLGFSSAAEH
jgi:hypothetical protein